MRSDRVRRDPTIAITDVEPSLPEQIDQRRKRYAITMGLRTACLVLAALTSLLADGPAKWALLALFILGAVALPWIAVLVANDRAPRPTSRRSTAMTPGAAPERSLPAPGSGRVIDQ